MGYCSYLNEEKSGPWSGYHCDMVGDKVDSSLYKNYCTGEVSCQYCPHLGGDDRYRKDNSSSGDSGSSGSSYSYASKSDESSYSQSYSSYSAAPDPEPIADTGGGYSGGGGEYSGGGGFSFGGILFGIIAVVVAIAVLKPIVKEFLLDKGILRSKIAAEISMMDSGLSPEDFSLRAIRNDRGLEYDGKTEEFDEEGKLTIKLRRGSYDFAVVYENRTEDHTLSGNIDGSNDYDFTHEVTGYPLTVLYVVFQDQNGQPISADSVPVRLLGGKEPMFRSCRENALVIGLEDAPEELILQVSADGMQELEIAVDASAYAFQKVLVTLYPLDS